MAVRRIANAPCLLLSVTVSTASLVGAQAGGQPSLDAIRAACAGDAQKLCAGVQPGGGRIVACLKEHKDSLSDRCKQAAGLAVNPGSSPAPSAASGLPSAGAAAIKSPPSSSTSVPGPGAWACHPRRQIRSSFHHFGRRWREVPGTRHHGYRTSGNARRDCSHPGEMDLQKHDRMALRPDRGPFDLFLSRRESRQRRGLFPISVAAGRDRRCCTPIQAIHFNQ